ncbi:MAG: tetratricopeptide repeat protein [Pirellulales bacterium]
MARKLSRVACCLLIVAASELSLTAALAQSVQVAPATKHVVNPFAAKRQTSASAAAPAPKTVPPAEAGPKTFQNPFAGHEQRPRFMTPRLQPGPMSRWHRAEQTSPPPQADERPIQAIAIDSGVAKGDLSGPLAHEERRSALFALPGAESIDLSNPPDPAKFGHRDLQQPTWLLPHETQVTTVDAGANESYAHERAVAQQAVDPFEEANVAEVFVSDDAPVATTAASPAAAQPVQVQHVEPIAEKQAAPMPEESIIGPELKAEPAKELAVVQPKLPQLVVAEPVFEKPIVEKPTVEKRPQLQPAKPEVHELPESIVQEIPKPEPPQPVKRGAEDWYADAEKAAAKAVSTDDLAAVVQLCQSGIDCHPVAELAASLRSLAAWACNRSGEIESDQRREDEALKAFELAIQWDPNCWLALHNRAVSRAQQGDLEGALSDFNRSLELNPGLAVAFRNRGELLAATGRTEEAIEDYTMALAQLPQDADLLTMRGEAYHRLGEYEKALADLTQAIEIAPHSAPALSQRGNVQAELGKFAEAVSDFQKAQAADPNSAEAQRSLAWLLATCPDQRFRNPQQALSAAEAATKLAAPGDPFVLDALAAAHASAGQFDRAVEIQQEAIVNVPEDFADPFQERLALYNDHRPFRNDADQLVDENVRAASLETDRGTQR